MHTTCAGGGRCEPLSPNACMNVSACPPTGRRTRRGGSASGARRDEEKMSTHPFLGFLMMTRRASERRVICRKSLISERSNHSRAHTHRRNVRARGVYPTEQHGRGSDPPSVTPARHGAACAGRRADPHARGCVYRSWHGGASACA